MSNQIHKNRTSDSVVDAVEVLDTIKVNVQTDIHEPTSDSVVDSSYTTKEASMETPSTVVTSETPSRSLQNNLNASHINADTDQQLLSVLEPKIECTGSEVINATVLQSGRCTTPIKAEESVTEMPDLVTSELTTVVSNEGLVTSNMSAEQSIPENIHIYPDPTRE